MSKGITTRKEDFSKWYNELVLSADLAEHSDVRGCMVIKPHGFAIWEKMQETLDKMFKKTGHVNAYFPLFIPKSFFTKEASHVEGFAKECAVVTHYRLKQENGQIVVDKTAKLEEELIVRPTSETIIWSTYRKWIQSYRDLPLLINQWANVVRWEMRTRLFLRTTEFLWQEGHTAHATQEEAVEETLKMLNVYADFLENHLAIPVIKGVKTPKERFAGALETYTVETLMQDGKALQAGTSHFLGQNFAKAFDVKFTDQHGKLEYVWASSWGVSTRLMGALVMSHSDDKGLVLPPKMAPIQVVLIPIYKGPDSQNMLAEKLNLLAEALEKKGIRVKFDNRDTQRPGWKFAEYELKGVPIRIAMGERDIAQGTLEISRRDNLTKETIPIEGIEDKVEAILSQMQENLFAAARKRIAENSFYPNSYPEFIEQIEKGGYVYAHWDGTPETEEKIKEETKATIRCIPLDQVPENGQCIYSGKPSKGRVLFAMAY